MRRCLLVLALLLLTAPAAHGMKLNLLQGQTCANSAPRPCLVSIFIQDSSSTTGAGLTGLTSGSAGLVCYYARSDQGNAAATQHTLGAGTRGTWSATSNFVEKDATNMPGVYELSLVTAMLAANATNVVVMCKGATNMAPMVLEIALTNYDPQDSVRLGLTALPNVASGSAGAIPTTGTGANQISVSSGQVILQAGTGTGQLDFTSGVLKGNLVQIDGTVNGTHASGQVPADMRDILGTAVSTPATAGILDVNTKNINNVAAATPGASGGILISGSNSGTTTFGALTVTGATTHTGATVHTGNVSMAAGLTVTQSTLNGAGVSLTGNGTGQGLLVTGGATGPGAKFVGGGTSGDGIDVTTTSGDGLAITPTAGSGIVATANGTSKHGIVATGGTAGTSDGIKGVAGTGGVDIRGNLTGNVTGNLSGSVGSVTGAVGSVTAGVTVTTNNDKTGYSLTQAFPTNFSALAITAGGAVTVGTNSDKTGYSLTQAFPTNFSALSIDANGRVRIQGPINKNVALATPTMFLMTDSTNHNPQTGLTVACTRAIDGGAFAAGTLGAVSEIANGWYALASYAAGDLNGNEIITRCTATNADDVGWTLKTYP